MLLMGLLTGCGPVDSDTFVRFEVGEKSYKVKDPALVITRLVEGFGFYDLTFYPLSAVPGAIVQWRMKMEPLETLAGRNLDLNAADPNKVNPTVLLQLSEDLILQNQPHSKVHLTVERIGNGMIEGSFTATDLKYMSKDKSMTRTEDVTARFRVKLKEKSWHDVLRSRKRSRE